MRRDADHVAALTKLERVEALKALLVESATGGSPSEVRFRELRSAVLGDEHPRDLVPRWVRTHRTPSEFWGFIKPKFSTYRERRAFIAAEFDALIGHLERPEAVFDAALHNAANPNAERFTGFEPLGAGDFGEVWKAADTKLGRTVAVKFVPSPRSGATALAHARALASFNHPNIVRVYEVIEGLQQPGTDVSADAIVMEYFDGITLAQHISAAPTDARTWAKAVCDQLLDAIECLHRESVPHGDLHTENVLVAEDRVKLIDAAYNALTSRSTATLAACLLQDLDAVARVIGEVLVATGVRDRGFLAQCPERTLNEQRAALDNILGGDVPTASESKAQEQALAPVRGVSLVWRLPRGFVLLEDLERQSYDAWSTTAHYYDYSGDCIQGTHYHESYRWDRGEKLDNQCRKLGIPVGDWLFAYGALYCMMNVRDGDIEVTSDGQIRGTTLEDGVTTMHMPGPLALPPRPPRYRGLVLSAGLRDLIAEIAFLTRGEDVHGLATMGPQEASVHALEFRRRARLAVFRALPANHAARVNIEEVIEAYVRGSTDNRAWCEELRAALVEAVPYVENQHGSES